MKGLGGGLENVKFQVTLPRWEFNIFKSPPQGYVSRLKIAIYWVNFKGGGEGGKCKILVWEPK